MLLTPLTSLALFLLALALPCSSTAIPDPQVFISCRWDYLSPYNPIAEFLFCDIEYRAPSVPVIIYSNLPAELGPLDITLSFITATICPPACSGPQNNNVSAILDPTQSSHTNAFIPVANDYFPSDYSITVSSASRSPLTAQFSTSSARVFDILRLSLSLTPAGTLHIDSSVVSYFNVQRSLIVSNVAHAPVNTGYYLPIDNLNAGVLGSNPYKLTVFFDYKGIQSLLMNLNASLSFIGYQTAIDDLNTQLISYPLQVIPFPLYYNTYADINCGRCTRKTYITPGMKFDFYATYALDGVPLSMILIGESYRPTVTIPLPPLNVSNPITSIYLPNPLLDDHGQNIPENTFLRVYFETAPNLFPGYLAITAPAFVVYRSSMDSGENSNSNTWQAIGIAALVSTGLLLALVLYWFIKRRQSSSSNSALDYHMTLNA